MEHADKHMACVALSECGQFLALASSRGKKSLFLWRLDGQTWNFVSQRLIGRAASKIRFTHSASAVLVAGNFNIQPNFLLNYSLNQNGNS